MSAMLKTVQFRSGAYRPLIAPEQLVIDNIYRLIEYPGALQVVNFAEGKVSLAVVKAYYGGPLVGNALVHHARAYAAY
jgi:Trk K+ transport system NAD-binding subunit